MAKNRKMFGGIIVMIVLFIALLAVIGFGIAGVRFYPEVFHVEGDKTKFVCDIFIDSDLLSQTDIEMYDCNIVGACFFTSKQDSLFKFFGEEGVAKFIGNDGVTYAKVDYSVSDFSLDAKEYRLEGCTGVEKGRIVLEENGNIVDEKDVEFK